MLSKLSRRRGLQLEALGSVLICTVMLADRFLFTLQDDFVLTTAIISAVLLTIGIRVVKRRVPFVMPRSRSIDLDTPTDWLVAEALLEANINND